jgi:urea transport system permease protein
MGLRQLHQATLPGLNGGTARLGKRVPGRAGLSKDRTLPAEMNIGRLRRLLATVLILAGTALPARAQDFAALVAALGGDGFAAKSAAIVALGKAGDPRAVPVLQAMSGDRLRTAADGRVLIVAGAGAGSKFHDAVTGEEVAGAGADNTSRIIVNNRLRGQIEAALAALTLFSPDRDTRLAAAREALKHPSAETVAGLDKALAAEADPEIRAAMEESRLAGRLLTGSKDEQLSAVRALSGATDPQVKNLLDALRNRPGIDPELRRAADGALEAIGRRLQLVAFAANLFQGLSLGSVLLLAAIGLAITFGVMGVINMAHGEMIMLGAYSAFVCQEFFRALLPAHWFGAYLVVAIPVGFLAAGAVGVALERTVIRHLYGRPLETLLATWGIGLILQQGVRTIFGAPNREVANPAWMTGGFDPVGGFTLTWNRLYIVLFCFVVLGAIALILYRTTFGLHMRAVTQNRTMAAAMGIRTARVDALTFGLGSGIAGMAGVALSQIGNVSPNLGQIYIVDSFLVVVFGGVGNLLGTLVGALTLGLVNKLLEPVAGAILGKIVVLVAIILFIQRRPRGLFALKGRTAEAAG